MKFMLKFSAVFWGTFTALLGNLYHIEILEISY